MSSDMDKSIELYNELTNNNDLSDPDRILYELVEFKEEFLSKLGADIFWGNNYADVILSNNR